VLILLALILGVAQFRELTVSYGRSLGLGEPNLAQSKLSPLIGSPEYYFSQGDICEIDGHVVDVDEVEDGYYVTITNGADDSREFHLDTIEPGIEIGARMIFRFQKLPPSGGRKWSVIRVFEVWLVTA
jgi:hypothetical protein